MTLFMAEQVSALAIVLPTIFLRMGAASLFSSISRPFQRRCLSLIPKRRRGEVNNPESLLSLEVGQ